MRIKAIYTGGTIGSDIDRGVVSNDENKDIATLWEEKTGNAIEFYRVYIYSILSENITPENWQMLIDELNKDYSGYDGIIIFHGSDTLSFTSAMVALYCRNYKIPVVLTGSNKVLTDETANGFSNLTKTVDIIANRKIGVWTVFDKVYPACGVMEADYFTDKFSLGSVPCDDFKVKKDTLLKNRVLMIKAFPFVDYNSFDVGVYGAVLIVGYHSGTAEENGISILLEKCREKGIPLYLQGLKKDSAVYLSADNLKEKGVNLIFDETPEYAFAKLTFLINE